MAVVLEPRRTNPAPSALCWACSHAIALHDEVSELPLAGLVVHAACFSRETGQPAVVLETFAHHLSRALNPPA